MSLIFMDGLDHYSSLSDKWQYISTPSRTSLESGGRYNSNRLNILVTGGETNYIWRSMPNTSSVIIGFAFKITQTPGIACGILSLLDSSGVQIDLRINADLTFSITRNGTALTNGTSSLSIFSGVWYYVELKATISSSISANSCVLRVNNLQYINVSAGQSTIGSSASYVTRFALGRYSNNGSVSLTNLYYDDIYICDSNGSSNNDFLGDVRIVSLYPSGNGNYSQFAREGTLRGNNYLSVDDTTPDSDSTYVESSGIGNSDTYLYTDLPSVATSIKGVQFNTYARKTDGGFRQWGQVVRVGSSDYITSSGYVSDTYIYNISTVENNPSTGSSWTNSDINNIEAGIKLLS